MKSPPSERGSTTPPADPALLKRRGMLLGTGVAAVAGVAAAASRVLPAAAPEPQALAKQDAAAAGYRLSPHVLRYYETTRV